jgi:hypothetical protein
MAYAMAHGWIIARSIPTAMTATVTLRERILAFVAYFNQTAKPFR